MTRTARSILAFYTACYLATISAACSGSATGTGSPDGGASPTDNTSGTTPTPSSPREVGTGAGDGHDSSNPSGPSGGGNADGGAVPQNGPIQIQNLSFSGSSGSLQITFVLKNTGDQAINRLQEITIIFNGSTATALASCPQYPWTVSASQTSGIITLTLASYPVSSSRRSLEISYECVGVPSNNTTPSGSLSLASSGTLTVDLRGLMADAAPWSTSATTTR